MAKRSAAQKAATKKMLAANRARRTATTKTTPAKRTAPRRPVAAKTTAPAVRQAAPAPAVRKPSKARAAATRARAAAGKGMKLGMELLTDVVLPGAIGGGAASVVDVAYGYARKWIPEKISNSPAKHVIKMGAGIGLALLAQKAGVPAKHAKAGAIGVCAVGIHRALNEQIDKKVELNLNGMSMTVGELAAVLPMDEELNGLEALGALAAGTADLGTVIPFYSEQAA